MISYSLDLFGMVYSDGDAGVVAKADDDAAVAFYPLEGASDAGAVSFDELYFLGGSGSGVNGIDEEPLVGRQGVGEHEVAHLAVGHGQHGMFAAVGRGTGDELHGGILLTELLQVAEQTEGGMDEYHVADGWHQGGWVGTSRPDRLHRQEVLDAHVVKLALDTFLTVVGDVHGEPAGFSH